MGRVRQTLGSRGFRGASVMMLGTGIAQVVNLVATPVLTRIYPTEAFGYLALVTAIVGIATPVVALKAESALMLPREHEKATGLLFLGACATLLLSAAAGIIAELLARSGVFGAPSLLAYLGAWVFGLAVITGAFSLLSQFALRLHLYRVVASRSVVQAVGVALGQVGLASLSATSSALVGGALIGRVVGLFPLWNSVRRSFLRFTMSDLREVVREYWRFPVLFAPSALLNAAGLAIPLLAVTAMFGLDAAAEWGMAERILALPLVVIGAATGQVVEAHVADAVRSDGGPVVGYFLRVTYVLGAVAVLVAFAVIALGPIVVPWFLGSGWDNVAEIMVAMLPFIATRLVASPLSRVLVTLQAGTLNVLLDIARLALVILALGIASGAQLGLIETVLVVSCTFAAVYIATWVASFIVVRRQDRRKVS